MSIVWDPETEKPIDAAALEHEIRVVAPDAQVKLTLRAGVWVVRALRPAAMCSRGASLSDRDRSAPVVAILSEAGYPARG